jgi:hypothetical protein
MCKLHCPNPTNLPACSAQTAIFPMLVEGMDYRSLMQAWPGQLHHT